MDSVFLATEYQAALARLHRLEELLLLTGAGGLLTSVGAAAYAIGYRANLKLGYAWAAPLPFVATAVLLLALFTWRAEAHAQVNDLRNRAGIPAPPASLRAPLFYRLLALPAAAMIGLFGATTFVALRAIYTASRAAGTIFALVYGILLVAVLVAGWAAWRAWKGSPALTPSAVRLLLLPYPGDLLLGLGLGIAGLLAPLLTVGLNTEQVPILNALFRRNLDFEVQVPLAAVLALGGLYLVVTEGLLIPAGRLWKDLPSQPENIYAHIFARLVLAFPLAYLLGGVPLLVLALVIWIHQAVAALAARHFPHKARFELLWSALLPPLRFYAGVLAWVGSAWSFTHLLLLFCLAGFLALGFESARRTRRARLAATRGDELTPQQTYHLRSGLRWQRAGFLAAGLTALGLVVLQALAEDCGFFNAYLATGYGRCSDEVLSYRQAGPLNGALLVFDLLALGALACNLLVRLLSRAEAALLIAVESIRPAAAPILLIAAVGLVVASFVTGLPSLAFAGLLAGTAAGALWMDR